MEGANDEVISTLNELIEVCTDARDGFRRLAAKVGDEEPSEFLIYRHTDVRRRHGDPPTSGTTPASLHRGCMSVKAAVAGGDGLALLAPPLGARSRPSRPENALMTSTLPADVRSAVEHHYSRVKAPRAPVPRVRVQRTSAWLRDSARYQRDQRPVYVL
jgi:uncharacterized protein (TIGR02284 family)